jgi:hypothetical protein
MHKLNELINTPDEQDYLDASEGKRTRGILLAYKAARVRQATMTCAGTVRGDKTKTIPTIKHRKGASYHELRAK